MRRTSAALCVLLIPAAALAQEPAPPKPQSGGGEWIEYSNREDRFAVNLPGQPTTRDITYQPQRGKPLRGRVYTVQNGRQRYSVTVVDFTSVREPSDVLGSIAWEAWSFRKRGGEITYDAYAQSDRIPGHQLHIRNRDRTLTFAGIYLHASRLYILEATVPPDAPGAVHFQQSLVVLDAAGTPVRYELDTDGNRIRRVQ